MTKMLQTYRGYDVLRCSFGPGYVWFDMLDTERRQPDGEAFATLEDALYAIDLHIMALGPNLWA